MVNWLGRQRSTRNCTTVCADLAEFTRKLVFGGKLGGIGFPRQKLDAGIG